MNIYYAHVYLEDHCNRFLLWQYIHRLSSNNSCTEYSAWKHTTADMWSHFDRL